MSLFSKIITHTLLELEEKLADQLALSHFVIEEPEADVDRTKRRSLASWVLPHSRFPNTLRRLSILGRAMVRNQGSEPGSWHLRVMGKGAKKKGRVD